ncbi:hypothetical protein BurJ1DRAFT_4846 [Burkholderiales bacterium JOSHI_001]|nr:hypothetical protein BurJ1DRAFT_4846 [Burkholderiales bacterium JOSHI_001]
MRSFLAALATAVLAAVAPSAQAFCGFYAGKADTSLFNRASQVVLARDGQRTVIAMQNDYQGPLSEFALVVPTPEVIRPGQVKVADRALFERLDAFSSPRLAEYHDADPCRFDFAWGRPEALRRMAMPAAAMAPAAQEKSARDTALGVTVAARFTLEEYDIVSLSATQSTGLETWLHENGYRIPAGAHAALAPYIAQGLKFFVAKVNLKEQARLGFSTLRPLQFAYTSDKFMLPMRLGMLNAAPGEAQDLIVYVLTRKGRVEAANYRTVKLPTDMNLPPAVRPRFADFYKAMFERAAQREEHRAVFTEYFWDMGWCDPCAAQPLTATELLKAGAFWVGDAAQAPAAGISRRMPLPGGGAQDALLTRLHLRYTPATFVDDLMLVQTGDRGNWQARYVIQNPFDGSEAQCQQRTDGVDCVAACRSRGGEGSSPQDCLAACRAAKTSALEQARQYYRHTLPQRAASERDTLAQLTGWSGRELDAVAPRPAADAGLGIGDSAGQAPWWQRVFNTR